MSRPAISSIKLSNTLTLSECHPTYEHKGTFWLYDKTRGMNLAMGADTPQDAYVEALTYYQKRLIDVEKSYKDLQSSVDSFVDLFKNEIENQY
jgi:hypothetical protein